MTWSEAGKLKDCVPKSADIIASDRHRAHVDLSVCRQTIGPLIASLQMFEPFLPEPGLCTENLEIEPADLGYGPFHLGQIISSFGHL